MKNRDLGTITFAAAFASVACASAAKAQAPPVHWERQKAETLQHFMALVRIDTSNPPGNETKVVEYLKKVLESENIATRIFALDPNRANLVARLKGNGTRPPILILGHIYAPE